MFHSLLIAILHMYCHSFWLDLSWTRPHSPLILPYDWWPFSHGSEGFTDDIQHLPSTSSSTVPSSNHDEWSHTSHFHDIHGLSYNSYAPPPPPDPFLWPAFPSRLFAALTLHVLIAMWFYGLLLKCKGFTWDHWKFRTCKTMNLFPCLRNFVASLPLFRWAFKWRRLKVKVYDPLRDAPTVLDPPLIPSHRKDRNRIPISHRTLALFALAITSRQTCAFELSSSKDFTNRLRKYRSFQGVLQTDKLNPTDLLKLQDRIRESSKAMTSYAQEIGTDPSNVTQAILDSGCSFTALNSFRFVKPDSIRRLSKPIRIGGIAGGLDIHYVGITEFEVLFPSGKVVETFEEQCFVNEDLPDSLVSPQAFLSHQPNLGKGELDTEDFVELHRQEHSKFEQHFRIFADRTEWHKD